MSRTPLSIGDGRGPRPADACDSLAHPATPVPASLRLVTSQKNATRSEAILLAYRSGSLRHVLAAQLLREGYCVTCCDDGDAALRCLRATQAELVITGVLMPNMDGLELIGRLRSRHPTLPIMALAEEQDQMSHIYLRYARLAGATSTCTLPTGRETLLGEIDRILIGRHAIRKTV